MVHDQSAPPGDFSALDAGPAGEGTEADWANRLLPKTERSQEGRSWTQLNKPEAGRVGCGLRSALEGTIAEVVPGCRPTVATATVWQDR